MQRAGSKLKFPQRCELLPPPIFLAARMHYQDAVPIRQTRDKSWKEFRMARPIAKVIDAGEAVIGGQACGTQSGEHRPAKRPEASRLEPGKPLSPKIPQRFAGIANVGTLAGRQALDELDQPLLHAGQLVNVKMPVDEIRSPSAFVEKKLILRRDLKERLPGTDAAQQRTAKVSAVSRKMRRLGGRGESRRGQCFIRQTKMKTQIHIGLVLQQSLQSIRPAPHQRDHAGNRAQPPQTAEFENRPVNVVTQSVIVCADDHFR